MKHLIIVFLVLYCTRTSYMVGADDNNHFFCGDKNETWFDEFDISKLRGKQVPHEWTRVKLTLYPFHPIGGYSIWPFFGYRMKNLSDQYNNGRTFHE